MRAPEPWPPPPMAEPCSQAKCEYCGRYGSLGSCAGCGAPNVPMSDYVEVTCYGDRKRQFIQAFR